MDVRVNQQGLIPDFFVHINEENISSVVFDQTYNVHGYQELHAFTVHPSLNLIKDLFSKHST